MTRMVMINSLVFILCLLPFQIYNINVYSGVLHLTKGDLHTLDWTARLLESTNASANPIIYTATNSRYREAFLQIFCRRVNKTITSPKITEQDTQL